MISHSFVCYLVVTHFFLRRKYNLFCLDHSSECTGCDCTFILHFSSSHSGWLRPESRLCLFMSQISISDQPRQHAKSISSTIQGLCRLTCCTLPSSYLDQDDQNHCLRVKCANKINQFMERTQTLQSLTQKCGDQRTRSVWNSKKVEPLICRVVVVTPSVGFPLYIVCPLVILFGLIPFSTEIFILTIIQYAK